MADTHTCAYNMATVIDNQLQKDVRALELNLITDDRFTKTLAKLNYLRTIKTTIELLEQQTMAENRRILENG